MRDCVQTWVNQPAGKGPTIIPHCIQVAATLFGRLPLCQKYNGTNIMRGSLCCLTITYQQAS